MINFQIDHVAITSGYNNHGAHNQLKSMMARKERLSIYFSIDLEEYYYVKVESKTTSSFKFRINRESLHSLLSYLEHGECDFSSVNPLSPQKAKVNDGDLFRTAVLKKLIESNTGKFQVRPAFLDKPDRLTVTATFPYGAILFPINRTTEAEEYLKDYGLFT